MAKVQPKVAAPAPAPKAPVAAAPVAPAPAGAAKPGTPAPVSPEKQKKVGRIAYPGLLNAEGKAVALAAVPTDWDRKVHKNLVRKNFASEDLFLDYRASMLETEAADLRKRAEVTRSLGSTAERAKAKRLMQMTKRIEELKAQLSAAGVDVSALLTAAGETAPETEGDEAAAADGAEE
jgi:hypothetical protein